MKAPKQPKKSDRHLEVKKSNKKTPGKPLCPTARADESFLFHNYGQINHPIEAKFTVCAQKARKDSSDFDTGIMVSGSLKIKLQLFPADENTRIGLEKDGFCPYLELTLSPRKKISSVLKHIMNKWGRSSIAVGEPKLLSSNIDSVHVTSQKVWTLDDPVTCAKNVYEALGRPSIFRLWYCWFPKCQPYLASASNPGTGYSLLEAHDNHTDYLEKHEKQKETKTNDDFQLTSISENNLLGAPSYYMEKNVKPNRDEDKNLLSWFDSCTNISIGGLFSEASLQGKINTKSRPSAGVLEPDQATVGMKTLVSSTVPPSHQIHSSILDAEDTCSSFSFRKLFLTGNDASSMDDIISTKSHTSSSAQEAAQVGKDHQGVNTNLILSSEDRSLGLRSINWTDSLGPFDLFVPSSRNIRNCST